MPDRFRRDEYDEDHPDVLRDFPPLPAWLARRLLRPGEQVTWVRGPRLAPRWERYVTHPLLFVVALALAVGCVGLGLLIPNEPEFPVGPAAAAGCLVFGSILVLGLSSGYFTRLVVTDRRLFIVQGREVCRTWGIEELPPSLVRFGPLEDGEVSKTVDLDSLKTMLGGSSDQFTDSKTIMAFAKQLRRNRGREDGRP